MKDNNFYLKARKAGWILVVKLPNSNKGYWRYDLIVREW